MTAARMYAGAVAPLDRLGTFLPQLALRLLLAYEFFESGWQKLRGENWFAEIQAAFPLPFSVLPADLNWHLATWTELLGAIALVSGFATRFVSASFLVLAVVAWSSVHAGLGYNVCQNGFKLPLIYIVLLLPLLLGGGGRASLDYWLTRRLAHLAT